MTFDTMVGVFFLLAALVLWELETMRKDAARVRVVMEREAEIRERGYKCIESIQRMLASEIQRQRHSRGELL